MIKKNNIRDVLLLIGFLLLISWTTDFKFLTFEDVRLIIVIFLATSILILIGNEDFLYKLEQRFRFNLFLTGIVITLFLELNYLLDTSKDMTQSVLLGLRPLLFCLVLYIPIINIIRNMTEREIQKTKSKINRLDLLTNRETEVYKEILKGITNQEISENLYIAETTVKKHVQNILKKLQVENKSQIISEIETIDTD